MVSNEEQQELERSMVVPARVEDALGGISAASVVLDVGGASRPLGRANWVIDICPYRQYDATETVDGLTPRFTEQTWIQRDACLDEPWPFADNAIDFVFCSHTLEDIRDPLRVCREMSRVARAGYIEMPSREMETTRGIELAWELSAQAGAYHHRWLCEFRDGHLVLLMKPAFMHGSHMYSFPRKLKNRWEAEGKTALGLLWQDRLPAREETILDIRDFQASMRRFVEERAGYNLHMWFYDNIFMPCRSLVLRLRRGNFLR